MEVVANPTARALMTLEVLQDSPGITADRLGRRLGVSDRAVRRYVALLREAGIPVDSTSGRYGGYRLGRGGRPAPLMLSAAEALGLVMAVLEGRPGAVEASDPVGSALGKVARVLPASVAASVTALRQVTTAQTGTTSAAPDPQTTAVLVGAAEARRRVRISYRLRQEREMDVDPWAVSVWRGRWYLLGWSHTAGARRVLRVDRVASAVTLDEEFCPPAGLDPIAVIEEHLSTGWRYDVEVVVDAPAGDVARWLPRSLGRLEPIDDEHTRLVGTTDEPRWYAQRLAQLEAPFHVVAGVELRAAVRDLGALLARAAGV